MCCHSPENASAAVHEKLGPAVRITNLEFKQHNIYFSTEIEENRQLGKAKKGFSFNGERGRQKREKFYFPWKQQPLLSLKRPYWSLFIGFLEETEPECPPGVDMKASDSSTCLPIPSSWRNLTIPPILNLLLILVQCHSHIMTHTGTRDDCKQGLQNAPSPPRSNKVGRAWAKAWQ